MQRSRLVPAVGEAIAKASTAKRCVAVLMLRLKPKDRLFLFTQQDVEAQARKEFEQLAQLLRPADRYCIVDTLQTCILLPDLAAAAQATLAAHKLSRAMAHASRNPPGQSWARLLIGIACCPDHAEDAESLLMRADAAATQAEQSEDGIWLSDEGSTDGADGTLPAARAEALEALRSNAFTLAYQPQVDLASGRCESVEALLRAKSTDGGALPPPLLVAAAEEEGKIGFLTSSVLHAALRQLSVWASGGLPMRVSVNLSTHNLRDRGFPDVVARSLATWGMRAERLTLEIVESSMVHSFTEAATSLHRLKDLGVQLSLDDFGTGYSCLAYLRQLPFDELKVDRAFVHNLNQSAEDRRLVQAIIDLAHNFDLRAVAEGVQDEATLRTLQGMGCDAVQGHVLSEALTADGFTRWLERFANRPAEGDNRPAVDPNLPLTPVRDG
ncbi:MAG TPA: GGDEF domain-containing phosphodiesterase [Burkholderiales bacterium]|nr:GGDEF domain-containing phosphodiesterase [Burkholderiales bacterium]